MLTGEICETKKMVIIILGERFNNWTIIGEAEDRIDSSGKHHKRVLCRCDCGTTITKDLYKLKSGAKMCRGCYLKLLPSKGTPFIHKNNEYDLSGDFGVGFIGEQRKEFYFDLDDYDKISPYCWTSSNNYIRTHIGSKGVSMHRLILGLDGDSNVWVDHINRNPSDNRKSNPRICTQSENAKNRTVGKNSTSGIIGVYFDKRAKKWYSIINCDKKSYYLGSFDDIDSAVSARKQAEIKFFQDFAPN